MTHAPVVALRDLANVDVGYAFKSADFSGDPSHVRLLRGDNIAQGNLRWDGAKYLPPSAKVDDRYQLKVGDCVVAMDRPWIGAGLKRAVVRNEDVPSLLVQRVARLRTASSDLLQAYLNAVVDSTAFSDHLVAMQTGTAVPHVSAKQIAAFEFPLPPLAVQQAIAEVLGALDDKIAANAQVVATGDRLAEAKTKAAVARSIRVPLTELAVVTMGSSPRGESLNEDGTGTVFYQGVRDFGVRTPAPRVWTESVTRWAQAGDTLLSVRAPVGRVNVAVDAVCIGRGLASIRSTTSAPWTLFNLLKAHPELWAPFDAEGTIFSSINRSGLQGLAVPTVPSVHAASLEAELTAIELLIAAQDQESNRLAKLRDALLPELMSGRLRVKDAERSVEEVL